MEVGIFFAQGGGEDDVGIDTRSTGVVVEGIVDGVIGGSA